MVESNAGKCITCFQGNKEEDEPSRQERRRERMEARRRHIEKHERNTNTKPTVPLHVYEALVKQYNDTLKETKLLERIAGSLIEEACKLQK